MGAAMIVKISSLCAHLAMMFMLANPSHAIDFRSLSDQSNYRYSGGVVAMANGTGRFWKNAAIRWR